MTTNTTTTNTTTTTMKTANISLNSQTKKHPITLSNLGYKGKVEGERILVEVTGFVTSLDLTSGVEPLLQLIAEKKACTYGTKVTLPGGVVKKGMNIFSMKELNREPFVTVLRKRLSIPAERFLDFSALVMNDGIKEKKEKAISSLTMPEGWG